MKKTLIFTTAYLAIGYLSQQLTLSYVKDELKKQHLSHEKLFISPTAFNNIYWRITFRQNKKVYSTHCSVINSLFLTKPLNFKHIATDSATLPNYFLKHPRSQAVIDNLNGAYSIKKLGENSVEICDFRFFLFYSKKDKEYKSVFHYLISQNNKGQPQLTTLKNRRQSFESLKKN